LPALSEKRQLRDSVAVVLVSIYLLGVGTFLVLTRRIASPPFRRILRALTRKPYSGALTNVQHESGFCFYADLPAQLLSDYESYSSLRLLEDGRPLGPAHVSHDDIRKSGNGRFAHWGPRLYFSASDSSDPRSNGRSYTVQEVRISLFSGV
jgi:hypothetical protein